MGRCKHIYTDETFPTNTGSLTRPARFNLRLTCSGRARVHKVFDAFRSRMNLPTDANYAAVFEAVILPTLEHVVWKIDNGDAAVSEFFRSLARPLPKDDHLRAVYLRLKAKFEKGGAK